MSCHITCLLLLLLLLLLLRCSRCCFPAAQVSAAVVTCGGLCPGLNDVVQVRGGAGGMA